MRRGIYMSIDEKIAKEKANAEKLRKIIETGYDGEISIEAIFCDDTAAIKEVYERFENCAKEHEQLAEWLEELKCYKNDNDFSDYADRLHKIAFNSGYNKAIYDLLEDANEMAIEVDIGTYTMKAIGIGLLEQIAEQLKAGE